jgi:hypothetical protein
VALRGTFGQIRRRGFGQFNRPSRRRACLACPLHCPAPVAIVVIVPFAREEVREMRFNGEAGLERSERRIGRDLGGVDVQLLPPDQSRRKARFDDRLEEAAEDVEAVALADAAQTRVVG